MTNPSELASKAGQVPNAQSELQAQMPAPANPADDDGSDPIATPPADQAAQGQQAGQPLRLSDDGDDDEAGMFAAPDAIKQAWNQIKPEDREAMAQASQQVSRAIDQADNQQPQAATPETDLLAALDVRERILLERAGHSPADLSQIAAMDEAQRGIFLRMAERVAAPAPNYAGHWNGAVPGFGPGHAPPPTQQGVVAPVWPPPNAQPQAVAGGLPGYPMPGQPQYQPQAAQPAPQPQIAPLANDAELARVAQQMGMDVDVARQFIQLSTIQQQQAIAQRDAQRDAEIAQVRQQIAAINQQNEQQQVMSARAHAHQMLAQRYPQLQDADAFMSYALNPHTDSLARSYEQQGYAKHEALAAAVETMAAPTFVQQAGHTQQRQLHQAAQRSRQTGERLPSVNRAPSMPALPQGEAGVDALWDQPQLRAMIGA